MSAKNRESVERADWSPNMEFVSLEDLEVFGQTSQWAHARVTIGRTLCF